MLIIANITTGCIEYYFSGNWFSLCGTCPPPLTPTVGTHVSSETQIVWNWNASAGADGYKYNTVNDYATATNNGMTSTFTQEGLNCETQYTLYVWAYNICGNSTALSLSQTTTDCPFFCGTSTVSFTYNGQQVSYGTVESNGRCWLDRNLGASQVASSSTDHLAYGDLFQWGRVADGHQLINWASSNQGTPVNSTTSILSNNDIPSHSNFITNTNIPYDWRSPQNNNLWQGVSGVNNPCPNGWRLPTETEWNTERQNWSSQNSLGAIASPLKLPLAGLRLGSFGSIGSLVDIGSYGYCWASTVDVSNSKMLVYYSSGANVNGGSLRSGGASVRCIKD